MNILRLVLLLSFSSLLLPAANLTTQDGQAISGTIKKTLGTTVFLISSENGSVLKIDVAALSDASRAEVDAWKKANPDRLEVHTKAETPPQPLKTVTPKLDGGLTSEEGIVTVWVIIDEKGKVLLTEINKSTNEKLNQASQDCVQDWVFKPATQGGSPVKSELVIPFRFQAS